MCLEQEVSYLVSDIVALRRELDALLGSDCLIGQAEMEWIRVLEEELRDLNMDVDRACRWLSSCGVSV